MTLSMHMTPLLLAVQGDCTSKPPSAGSMALPGPEIQWKAPQCVIIGRTDLLYVDKSLWIDSLYLRPRPSTWYPFRFIRAYEDAALYATNVTLQGNGPFNTTAFRGYGGSQALFEGVTHMLKWPNLCCRCIHCRRLHMHFHHMQGQG